MNGKFAMVDSKNLPEKSKSPRLSRPFAIDFVVPIQLEECVIRAENLALESQMRIKIRPMNLTDKVSFDVESDFGETTVIHGGGTMRRWQGTLTRIQGTVQPRPIDTNRLRVNVFLIFWLGAAVLFFPVFSTWYLWNLSSCLAICFAIPVLFVTTGYLITGTRRYRQRQKFTHHLRYLLTAES